MEETLICRFQTLDLNKSAQKNQKGGMSPVTIFEIYPSGGGSPKRMVIPRSQILKLNYGDTIKCVAGAAAVFINPGTGAGMFILCSQIPFRAGSKYRTELEITDELTKTICRGHIWVNEDIGNIHRSTSATTR